MSKSNSMPQAGQLYESPIINGPYDVPELHLALQNPPPTDNRYEVKEGRREPGVVHENTSESLRKTEPYPMIAKIREKVDDWRKSEYPGVDGRTAQLLFHWQDSSRERRLFFCQLEAIETLIWLHTCHERDRVCDEIHEQLSHWNEEFNKGLPRISTKMATGTGKTVVIAMLMLWMAVRSRDPINNFLVITPGTVVTERLKEGLIHSGKGNVFIEHQLQPPDMPAPLLHITIVHRHLLEPRSGVVNSIDGKPPDRVSTAFLAAEAQVKANKSGGIVASADETVSKMVDRILGSLPDSTPLCIINDEAHHCYAQQDKENRKWFDAILRIRDDSHLAVTAVHDFSATPIWLGDGPSSNSLGEIFPWTVSDFPLIEAVESGLTKIPRLPMDTNIEEQRHGRRVYGEVGPKSLPGRVTSDIGRYLELLVHHHLTKTRPAYEKSGHNPILCVVADTIENAEAFFRYIAGHWDEDDPAKSEKGKWDDFSNIEAGERGELRIKDRPPTLLVHSEVGKGKGAEEGEIGVADNVDLWAFFGDGPARKKGKNKWLADKIRTLFGTAGRKGEDGEGIRCIISVSMLTEGWDCRTVTEIFGFRRFESELLVEQVTGRALRRTEYILDDDTGRYPEQHANLIGVPFSWVPEGGLQSTEARQIQPYECRVVDGREHLEIRMPRVERYELVPEHISLELNPVKIASHQIEIWEVENSIEISFEGGLKETLMLEKFCMSRDKAIWKIAAMATRQLIENETNRNAIRERLPIMRDLLVAARKWWMHPASKTKGLEKVMAHDQVAEKCADALIASCNKKPHKAWIRPHLFPNNEWATSAKPRSFVTRLKHRYPDPNFEGSQLIETRRSQRNVAPCHSAIEARIAKILDESEIVDAWVRNEKLGFSIPYRGSHGFLLRYIPDFVARSRNKNYLAIEYKGDWEGKSDMHEDSKRSYAEKHWRSAVNADEKIREETGWWDFLWIDDDKGIQEKIEKALAKLDAKFYSKPANPKEAT